MPVIRFRPQITDSYWVLAGVHSMLVTVRWKWVTIFFFLSGFNRPRCEILHVQSFNWWPQVITADCTLITWSQKFTKFGYNIVWLLPLNILKADLRSANPLLNAIGWSGAGSERWFTGVPQILVIGGYSPPGFESKAPPTATRRRRHGAVTASWTSSWWVHLANEV